MKRIRNYVVPIFLGLLTLCVVWAVYRDTVVENATTVFEMPQTNYTDLLQEGDSYSQEVVLSETDNVTLTAFQLAFVTYGKDYQDGTLTVTLEDGANVLYEESLSTVLIDEWDWVTFTLDDAVEVAAGDTLTITVEATAIGEDTSISISENEEGNLSLRTIVKDLDRFEKLFFVFTFIGLALLGMTFFFVYKLQLKPEYLFLTSVLPFIVMMSVLLPAGDGPDEYMHVAQAYLVADRLESFDLFADTSESVTITTAEINVGLEFSSAPDHDYYNWYYNYLTERQTDVENREADSQYLGENPLLMYFFPALGVMLGRAFHFSGAGIIFMARLLGMVPTTLLIFNGIKRMPFGKEFLLVFTMLPMVQQMLGVVNNDGMNYAMTVCYIALLLRQWKKETWEKWDILDFVLMAFCSIMFALTKYGAFVALSFLPLIFLWKRKESLQKALLGAGTTVLSLVIFGVNILKITGSNTNGTWWSFYTISDVLHDPLYFFEMYIRTVMQEGGGWILSALGQKLGWYTIEISPILIYGFMVLLFMSVVAMKKEDLIPTRLRAVFVGIVVLGIGCILGGLTISWTPSTEEVVWGIQGRYFLPFLPYFLFAVQPKSVMIGEKESFQKNVVMTAIWLQFFVIMYLFFQA